MLGSRRLLHVGTLLLGAILAPLSLGAQDIPWPRIGTQLRITTLPGPPTGIDQSLAHLRLDDAPGRLVRRYDDGRVRFSASLVRVGDPFAVVHATEGTTADLSVAQLTRIEAYAGDERRWGTGLTLGAVVGAVYGVIVVSTNSGLAGDYVIVPLIVAIPFSGLGALIGGLITTDVWDPIYTRRR
jgi:hypothetical protein